MEKVQVLNSRYYPLLPVILPDGSKGRQVRYHELDLAAPTVPTDFEDFLQPVKALCAAAGAVAGTAYLTVDEKLITAGMSQRRPKPHVDGCFHKGTKVVISDTPMSWIHESPVGPEVLGYWGGGGGGGWLHYCNDVGATSIGRMAVIVAASVPGCKAWKGTFLGRPAKDGDLSHIQDQLKNGEVLPANVGYLLSPDCVHESMIFEKDTLRTFIRIALPVEFAESCKWD